MRCRPNVTSTVELGGSSSYRPLPSIRAVALATAFTVVSLVLTIDNDDSSVKTTTELSGRQVPSGAGAR
jgi:hypothetical protein